MVEIEEESGDVHAKEEKESLLDAFWFRRASHTEERNEYGQIKIPALRSPLELMR